MVNEIHLTEEIRLKKPHPCGSYRWVIVRLGADIGLRCVGCGRRIIVERRALEHQMHKGK